MSRSLTCVTGSTDMGWIGILGSAKGLLSTTLPRSTSQEALELLGDRVHHATWSPGPFNDLIERLRRYFGGYQVAFPDSLDLSVATSFQREVWRATRLIPHGETRSYAWVANHIGRQGAVRAVGQALGKNPLAIIVPCHRVIASDGGLGGFGGGLEMKRRLLFLEAKGVTE